MENEIVRIYKKHGDAGYIGEEVTQYQHALQCYLCAEKYIKSNKDKIDLNIISEKEIKLGAFLHDVGHLLEFEEDYNVKLMDNLGVLNHEEEGYKYLKNLGFSDNICELARNHINTKRYFISKNNSYYNNLSEASKGTFEFQGGKMNNEEIETYEKNPLFNIHLLLRTWDDEAKSTDPELLEYIKNFNISNIFK